MKDKKTNNQIKYSKIKLIGTEGDCVVMSSREAIDKAKNLNLDLVEVQSPTKTDLAICKIFDYGKYKYEQKKKVKQNKKNKPVVKDIKIHFNTAEHDMQIKHKKIKEFLEKNYIVNYIMELKGRDVLHFDYAIKKFKEHLSDLKDNASWDKVNTEKNGYKGRIFTQLRYK